MASPPALPVDNQEPPEDAATEADRPSSAGERLLRGHWSWLDFLIVGPILAQSVYYYVGVPLGQWLILHDLAVQAALLRGSTVSMILCGAAVRTGTLSPWVALLAPLPCTMLTDPCFFYAGRRYGRVLIDYLGQSDPRWKRRVTRGERIFSRFAGWAVFLAPVIWLPNAVFYFLAGETRMRFSRFILLDLAGELCYIAEIEALGYFIGKPAQAFANSLSGYSLWIILGTIAVAVLLSARGAARRARADQGLGS
ncbi:MAG TPA: VTT domain-containing protein [Candidatus Binatia bacterium]|nr:VTT domain-containing protein [Candidatus Binatia bacterium]